MKTSLMKAGWILALGAAGLLTFGACGGGKAAVVDHADPAKVTKAIFDAAAAGDASQLKGLCDPAGKNDGDTRRICELTKEHEKWSEFVDYFKKGKLVGDATVTGDKAAVSILFGPDGTKPETMKLVQRDGKWYLSSF